MAHIHKYEVWVTTRLTETEKDEVSQLLSRISARGGQPYHMGAVAGYKGNETLDSFTPTIID